MATIAFWDTELAFQGFLRSAGELVLPDRQSPGAATCRSTRAHCGCRGGPGVEVQGIVGNQVITHHLLDRQVLLPVRAHRDGAHSGGSRTGQGARSYRPGTPQCRRRQRLSHVHVKGCRRGHAALCPVMLTSVTPFLGFTPLILERARGAWRFLLRGMAWNLFKRTGNLVP